MQTNSCSADKVTFEVVYSKYKKRHLTNNIFIEVEKVCGYKELISLYKQDTLIDMYAAVRKVFELEPSEDMVMYLRNSENANIAIRMDNTLVKTYISENRNIIQPIYPIPAPAVYKFYYIPVNVKRI